MNTKSESNKNSPRPKQYFSVKVNNHKNSSQKQDLKKVNSDHPDVSLIQNNISHADSNQTLIASKVDLSSVNSVIVKKETTFNSCTSSNNNISSSLTSTQASLANLSVSNSNVSQVLNPSLHVSKQNTRNNTQKDPDEHDSDSESTQKPNPPQRLHNYSNKQKLTNKSSNPKTVAHVSVNNNNNHSNHTSLTKHNNSNNINSNSSSISTSIGNSNTVSQSSHQTSIISHNTSSGIPALNNMKKTALSAQISKQLNQPKFALNKCEAPEPIFNLKASKSITHTDGVGAMMEEFKTKYEVTGIIGRGGGGTVYSGYRRSDKLSVAIKQVPKQKIKRWGTIFGFKVPIEFDLLNRVQQRHHSIIEMMDWYERRTSYVMVMERPPHSTDLFEYINRKGSIAENNARFIMKQLIEVMIICFKEDVFHRDIKDENIMINYHTYEVKLIDFGCGTNLKKSDYTEFAGTPEFYPPEWFNERRYVAEPQTVWSLGVLLWAILYGEVPFQDEQAIKDYTGSIIHIAISNTRIILSEDALRFLQKALHYDEKRRPSLKYMLKSTWIKRMRKISAHQEGDIQNKLWSTMQNNRNPEFLHHINNNGMHVSLATPVNLQPSMSTSQLPTLMQTKDTFI